MATADQEMERGTGFVRFLRWEVQPLRPGLPFQVFFSRLIGSFLKVFGKYLIFASLLTHILGGVVRCDMVLECLRMFLLLEKCFVIL